MFGLPTTLGGRTTGEDHVGFFANVPEACPTRCARDGVALQSGVPAYDTFFIFRPLLLFPNRPQAQSLHLQFSRLVWQLRPKFHIMAHLAHEMTTRRYNVRYEHCFRDESAIGVAKGILIAIYT